MTVNPTENDTSRPCCVAQTAEMGQPFLGGAGAVAADQDRRAVPVGVGDLRERLVGDPDVVGGGVRAGVPGRSIPASASSVLSSQASNG